MYLLLPRDLNFMKFSEVRSCFPACPLHKQRWPGPLEFGDSGGGVLMTSSRSPYVIVICECVCFLLCNFSLLRSRAVCKWGLYWFPASSWTQNNRSLVPADKVLIVADLMYCFIGYLSEKNTNQQNTVSLSLWGRSRTSNILFQRAH